MKVRHAILTTASPAQRDLPLQTLVDGTGARRSVFAAQLEEVRAAGIKELAVVIHPGDRDAFARAAGATDLRVHWLEQPAATGYADALLCAHAFAGHEPFLHLVGDHVRLSRETRGCARQVVDVATAEGCSVSAVQPTRERWQELQAASRAAIGRRRRPAAEGWAHGRLHGGPQHGQRASTGNTSRPSLNRVR